MAKPSGHGTLSAKSVALGRSLRMQEATQGFLMNHLINELLPPKGDGLRWANSDPVTGQAAWFDLRVRIEKAPEGGPSEPALAAQESPVGTGPKNVSYGEDF